MLQGNIFIYLTPYPSSLRLSQVYYTDFTAYNITGTP